jgi:hypothetical protein
MEIVANDGTGPSPEISPLEALESGKLIAIRETLDAVLEHRGEVLALPPAADLVPRRAFRRPRERLDAHAGAIPTGKKQLCTRINSTGLVLSTAASLLNSRTRVGQPTVPTASA